MFAGIVIIDERRDGKRERRGQVNFSGDGVKDAFKVANILAKGFADGQAHRVCSALELWEHVRILVTYHIHIESEGFNMCGLV